MRAEERYFKNRTKKAKKRLTLEKEFIEAQGDLSIIELNGFTLYVYECDIELLYPFIRYPINFKWLNINNVYLIHLYNEGEKINELLCSAKNSHSLRKELEVSRKSLLNKRYENVK